MEYHLHPSRTRLAQLHEFCMTKEEERVSVFVFAKMGCTQYDEMSVFQPLGDSC